MRGGVGCGGHFTSIPPFYRLTCTDMESACTNGVVEIKLKVGQSKRGRLVNQSLSQKKVGQSKPGRLVNQSQSQIRWLSIGCLQSQGVD